MTPRGRTAEVLFDLIIQPSVWQDELTGSHHKGPEIPLQDLLADLPVALLVQRS